MNIPDIFKWEFPQGKARSGLKRGEVINTLSQLLQRKEELHVCAIRTRENTLFL